MALSESRGCFELAAGGSFVLEGFEDVQPRRAACGEDRGRDACDDGDPCEDDELGQG